MVGVGVMAEVLQKTTGLGVRKWGKHCLRVCTTKYEYKRSLREVYDPSVKTQYERKESY